jgi:phenylacetate-CoA ligase
MPSRMMSLYTLLARHVMAPATDVLRGTHTTRYLTALEQSQWWPRERIEELQAQRLRALIQYAYDRTAYYRRVLDERGIRPRDIRSAADLPELPVLTRDIIRNHMAELRVSGIPERNLRHASTSGSTGTPLEFYSTVDDQVGHGFARGLRARQTAGVRLGDRAVSIRFPRGRLTADHARYHNLTRRFRRTVEFDSRAVTIETFPVVIEALRRTRARALGGYPGTLALLAAWLQDNDVSPPPLRAVFSGGEQLRQEQRQLIRAAFGAEPYSRYSAHECYEMAMECPEHSGMHIAAEDMVIEIVDDEGRPVSPGQEGAVLVTNLHNRALPFIRYDIGDFAAMMDGDCACGRGLPRLCDLVGRRCDVIVTPSGRQVSGTSLGTGRFALLQVRQYQVVQERVDSILVRIVPQDLSNEADLALLRERVPAALNANLGDDIRVDVVFVSHIEATAEGKHRVVISKLNAGSNPSDK